MNKFNTFYKQEQTKNLTAEQHNPGWHYIGCKKNQCNNCNTSLEAPEIYFERSDYSNLAANESIKTEILDIAKTPDLVEEKPFTSSVWENKELGSEIKKKDSLLTNLIQKAQKALEISKDIKEKKELESLMPTHIDGVKTLSLDDTGYTRSLGILQVVKEIEIKFNKKTHQIFDLITGMGNSSIIAAALSLGIDIDYLINWWSNDWSNAYHPGLGSKALTIVKNSLLFRETEGVPINVAINALKKLFSVSNESNLFYKFSDLKNEIYLLSIDVNKSSAIYTKSYDGGHKIYEALLKTAIDPQHFNTNISIDSLHTPCLGPLLKTSDIFIMLNNKKTFLTSITAPERVFNHKKSRNITKAELCSINKDKENHIYDVIRKELIKQTTNQIILYECKPIDKIKKNSTRRHAIDLALKSGMNLKPSIIKK